MMFKRSLLAYAVILSSVGLTGCNEDDSAVTSITATPAITPLPGM